MKNPFVVLLKVKLCLTNNFLKIIQTNPSRILKAYSSFKDNNWDNNLVDEQVN